MFEDKLVEYGAMGVFVLYLIYDKQVLMKKILTALEKIAERLEQYPVPKKYY